MSQKDPSDTLLEGNHMSASKETLQPGQVDTSFDYKDIEERKKSFYGKWLEPYKPSIEDMATAGFFFVGPGDFVECYSCGMKLHKWTKYDKPLNEHKYKMKETNKSCEHYHHSGESVHETNNDDVEQDEESYYDQLVNPCGPSIDHTAAVELAYVRPAQVEFNMEETNRGCSSHDVKPSKK